MQILKITSRSVTVELINDYPYFNDKEYDVFLNSNHIGANDKNVFTISDLTPNTDYELKILDKVVNFKTKVESLCLNVKDFHALADGVSDDTVKIQAAIMCCPKDGCVIIPKGTYLVTSLYLKSDMTLYMEDGAKLIASTKRDDFPVHPGNPEKYNFGVWEGSEVNNFWSIINGINIENVTVVGGEIDCQAEQGDWYHRHRYLNIAWRGHAIFFNRCKNIDFINTYVHNTQSWAIHPYFCENVSFLNIAVENKPSMPTTDGIDPDCSKNVVIKGCYFNVGDDCIAIKSGTIELAKKYRTPCENLIISNNSMKSGHGGVVFGSESSGGIINVLVNKCIFKDTDRGLRIKTRRGRGNIGTIDNVSFENILMDGVLTPFVINMFYNMGPPGGHEEYAWTLVPQPVDERTPVLGNFKFKDMECLNCHYAASVIYGLPEMPIKSVEFENVKFTYADDVEEGYAAMIEKNILMYKWGIFALNCDKIELKNVTFDGNVGDELVEIKNKQIW